MCQKTTAPNNDELIEVEINQIFKVGKLSKGSQKQYKSAIRSFYKDLKKKKGSFKVDSNDILNYLTEKDPSLTTINAIKRIQKAKKLVFTYEQSKIQEQIVANAKERIQHFPHRSWGLHLLQLFFENLITCRRDFLAFRLYILLNFAARISELSQITFKMILTGRISYIPQKQLSRGENCRRNFIISREIIKQTKLFMRRHKISEETTLDFGNRKAKILSKSFQKELTAAISQIERQINPQNEEYLIFLQNFRFHDLGHTKLQEMLRIGKSVDTICLYVQHQ